jgi:CheY-like chemotaxis protein
MIEAVNSGEALEALEANSGVQLPFTDVDMPGTIDGLALARQVHDRWPHIGIIVVSGKSMPQPHELPVPPEALQPGHRGQACARIDSRVGPPRPVAR